MKQRFAHQYLSSAIPFFKPKNPKPAVASPGKHDTMMVVFFQEVDMPGVRYEHVHSFKLNTADAKSIEDLIKIFEENVLLLRRWQEKGIKLDPHGTGAGYAIFYTYDEQVAGEVHFERIRTESGNPLPRR
jgi:hypothetical protein